MKHVIVPILAAATLNLQAAPVFAAKRHGDSLMITRDGRPVAEYFLKHPKVTRPFFSTLRAPDGTQLTRNFPPQPGDPQDHDKLHPGLWLAFGDLNGVDFWRNNGRIEHVRFAEAPRLLEGVLTFSVEEKYLAPDGKEVCRGMNRFCFSANHYGTILGWEATLRRADGPLTFGPQHEMGMGFRMATPLCVTNGTGSIISSHGGRNEAGNWGRCGAWWDYAGVIADHRAGILVVAAPENTRPLWSHARDYGFLAINPTGPPPGAQDVPSVPFTVAAGTPFVIKASFILHSSPVADKWDAAAAAETVLAASPVRDFDRSYFDQDYDLHNGTIAPRHQFRSAYFGKNAHLCQRPRSRQTGALSTCRQYGTGFRVETSATLDNPWTPATEGVGAGFVEITGNNVKFTFPAGVKNQP